MNRLSLERRVYVHEPQSDSPGRRIEVVVPIIDGTPLCEMVEDRDEGLDIAFFDPPSRQWLGEPMYAVGGRAVILDGSCGEAECCGVIARITLTDDRVIWSDFRARGPRRSLRDFTSSSIASSTRQSSRT